MPRKPAKPSKRNTDEMSQRLCRRVKELRTARGWSLDTLSQASDVSRSMLSQIEREQANPTLAVAYRIAHAFGISLGELVETPGASSAIEVVRADDPAHLYRADDDCTIRTLSPLRLEKDVEFYEVTLTTGGAMRSAPHFEGTREFLTVQKGKVRIESAEDTSELNRGDSAGYRADVPHVVENIGRGSAHLFMVVIYD
ncbi:MAG: helix-turn-helix domain-containing protein [Planctomycetaceae bacterium]